MRFYLIDKVIKLIPFEEAVGIKCVTRSEDFLEQHFPGYPVMPGVLIIEAMAQLSGYLLSKSMETQGVYVFAILSMIKKAKFYQMVVPGDQIKITSKIKKSDKSSALVIVIAQVNDKNVSESELIFTFHSINGKNESEKKQLYDSIINKLIIDKNPFLNNYE